MTGRFYPGKQLSTQILKKVELRHGSLGRGVFAAEDIQKGDLKLRFGGPIVTEEALPRGQKLDHDYFLQIAGRLFLGPSGDLDDYINHSCGPNSAVILSREGILLVAIKMILKQTQISFDYSTTMDGFWGKMACRCGARLCRGQVKNFHDLPDEQKRTCIVLRIVSRHILRSRNAGNMPARKCA